MSEATTLQAPPGAPEVASWTAPPPVVPYSARALYDLLGQEGYDFYLGVPCSLLNAFYRVLDETGTTHYAATREDIAIGVAAGAALAGRRPVVLMQNSGLGVATNALLSLTQLYRLPALLLVTWRGESVDSPEHTAMGTTTPALLELLGIPYGFASHAKSVRERVLGGEGPGALLVRRGELV
jgi:sulfopyruvate decarboxylase subunit alpha